MRMPIRRASHPAMHNARKLLPHLRILEALRTSGRDSTTIADRAVFARLLRLESRDRVLASVGGLLLI